VRRFNLLKNLKAIHSKSGQHLKVISIEMNVFLAKIKGTYLHTFDNRIIY
jgi:hypothetical protein